MDHKQLANATAAWVDAWLFGNVQPRVVINALNGLAARCAGDDDARAILNQGARVIAATPYGSVSPALSI